ncbi:MAG: MFS transporter [Dehalococcoidia bacterium]|nr:MFS transporter [Dehalococcoidia bacterium]
MIPVRRPKALGGIPALIVLANAQYRRVWGAGTLTELSRRVEQFTLSWYVLLDTDSPFALGLILVFLFVPRSVFAPIAGIIADRLNRTYALRAMQTVNVLNSSAILVLIATGNIQPVFAFASMLVQGATWTMDQPIRRTSMFDLVGPGQIISGVALDTLGFTVGRMAGPLLAGIFLGVFGFSEAYALALSIHLAALGLLVATRIPPHPPGPPRGTMLGGLVEAARYSASVPTLLAVVFLTLVMNGLGFPAQQFVPDIGKNHLMVGAALVGLLVAAEGFGQLVGAAVMASVRQLPDHGKVFIIGSVSILTAAMTFVWSPWYALTFVILSLGGLGQAAYSTMQSSLAMLYAPPEMRGQVLGILGVCIGFSTPLGTLEIGALATAFSTQWALSLNALAGLLLMAPVVLMLPITRPPTPGPTPGPTSGDEEPGS